MQIALMLQQELIFTTNNATISADNFNVVQQEH